MNICRVEETRNSGVGSQFVAYTLVEEIEENWDRENPLLSELLLKTVMVTYLWSINKPTSMAHCNTFGATGDCHVGNIHGCLTHTKYHDVLVLSKVLAALELRGMHDLRNVFDAADYSY